MADGCTSWVLNALQSVCVKQWLVIGLTNKCATNSNRHYNIILWKPDAIFCSTLELKPILVLTLKGLLISLSLRGKRWKTNTKAGHACWKVCFWRANLNVFFLESCLLHILNVFLSSLFFVHFFLTDFGFLVTAIKFLFFMVPGSFASFVLHENTSMNPEKNVQIFQRLTIYIGNKHKKNNKLKHHQFVANALRGKLALRFHPNLFSATLATTTATTANATATLTTAVTKTKITTAMKTKQRQQKQNNNNSNNNNEKTIPISTCYKRHFIGQTTLERKRIPSSCLYFCEQFCYSFSFGSRVPIFFPNSIVKIETQACLACKWLQLFAVELLYWMATWIAAIKEFPHVSDTESAQ